MEDEVQRLVRLVNEAHNVDDPTSLRLVAKRISQMPDEVIELIEKLRTEKLGLEQNQLAELPLGITAWTQLRYLNISNNQFKVFPAVLCDMPNLEILDISKNRIKSMPRNFNKLISLRALKISNNQLRRLPIYIANMTDLEYLKIDNNPLVFPPKTVSIMPKDEKDAMSRWLIQLKLYLRQHEQGRLYNTLNITLECSSTERLAQEAAESEETSDDEVLDIEYTSKQLKKNMSTESLSHLVTSRIPAEPSNSLKPIAETNEVISKQERKRVLPPKLSIESTRRDRSYSNDSYDQFRQPLQPLQPLQSVQQTHHAKSYSTDSISSYNASNGQNEIDRGGDGYFLKLKSLPLTEHLHTSDIALREAGRNILYALSQVYKALQQFVAFTGYEKLFTNNLFDTKKRMEQLIIALERFDDCAMHQRPDSETSAVLLEACSHNVNSFRLLINCFQKELKTVTQSLEHLRYSRTLLLMLHGSIAEVKFAWEMISPLLTDYTPYTGTAQFRARSMSRSNSSSGGSSYAYPYSAAPYSAAPYSAAPYSAAPYSAAPYSAAPYSAAPYSATPYSAGLTPVGIGAHASFVPITDILLSKIEVSISAVEKVWQPLSDIVRAARFDDPLPQPSDVKPAVKELNAHIEHSKDVARKLKKLQIAARNGKEELATIHEDIVAFLQTTIKLVRLAQAISHSCPFGPELRASLAQVTQSNIDLSIFMRTVNPFNSAQEAILPSANGEGGQNYIVNMAVDEINGLAGKDDAANKGNEETESEENVEYAIAM